MANDWDEERLPVLADEDRGGTGSPEDQTAFWVQVGVAEDDNELEHDNEALTRAPNRTCHLSIQAPSWSPLKTHGTTGWAHCNTEERFNTNGILNS